MDRFSDSPLSTLQAYAFALESSTVSTLLFTRKTPEHISETLVFVLYTMIQPELPPLKEGINGVKHRNEVSAMKEEKFFRRGGDSPNQQNIKNLSSRGCATEDFSEDAANACGCLVGVWQPYRDVIVTSGNVEMPA